MCQVITAGRQSDMSRVGEGPPATKNVRRPSCDGQAVVNSLSKRINDCSLHQGKAVSR